MLYYESLMFNYPRKEHTLCYFTLVEVFNVYILHHSCHVLLKYIKIDFLELFYFSTAKKEREKIK